MCNSYYDCVFFDKYTDMGAVMEFCNFEEIASWNRCVKSTECKNFISKEDAYKIIKEHLKKQDKNE